MTFRQILAKSWQMFKPMRKGMYIILFLVILGQIMNMLVPAIFGKVVDAISKQADFSEIIVLAIILFVVGLFSRLVLSYYREVREIKDLDFNASREITRISLGKLCSFSIGQHKNRNSAIKQSVARDGEDALMQFFYVAEFQIVPILAQILLTACVLFVMNWILSLVILLGLAVYIGVTFYINYRFKDDFKKFEEIRHENSKAFTEVVRNIPLIKVNAMEEEAIDEYLENFDEFAGFGKDMWLRYASLSRLRDIFPGITIFAVIVIGAWSAQFGKSTAGDVVMFIFWTSQIFGRLENLGNLHRQLTKSYITIRKYFSLMNVKPDIEAAEEPIRADTVSSDIEFTDVSFRYPVREDADDEEDEKPEKSASEAIKKVNLKIDSGQKVAFVGSSGAGKSTLIDLLLRAYDPDQGKVLIGGHDLKVIDQKSFLRSVGHVEQEVTLFDRSLRHNIAFGLGEDAKHLSSDRFKQVIDESRISTFFDTLEKGEDTIIGERGVKLSGGEKQRVGIGRAIIKSPRFLIFDEATSNLDSKNEKHIQEAIERISKGRTTIIVAHRLSTVKDADKIFVMDKGSVVSEGTHDNLMKSCSKYRKLVANQVSSL